MPPTPHDRIVVPTNDLGAFLGDLDGLSMVEMLQLSALGLSLEAVAAGEVTTDIVPWAAWVWARRHVEPGLPWGSDRVFIPLGAAS
jgi:hypothetical protein